MTFIVSISAPSLSAPVISTGAVTTTTVVINLVTPTASNVPLTGYIISCFAGGTLLSATGVAQVQFPFTITGLSPSTVYTFSAIGYEAAQNFYVSPSSAIVIGTTVAGGTLPAQVTGVTATAVSSSAIAVSWNPDPGATSYIIERNGSAIVTGYTSTSYTDVGLVASTTYSYRILGVNISGNGPISAAANATTQAASGSQTLKQYLYSLMGSGYLTAVTLNHFGSAGRLMAQLLTVGGPTQSAGGGDASFPNTPPTALNCSVQNVSGGTKTNSNQCPAIFGINFNTAGTAGSSIPLSEELARIQEHQSQNGIVHLTWMTPSPSQSGTVFSGNGTEYPGVIQPGNAIFNKFMYGAGRTAANPNAGVWAMAQGLISILSQPGAKSVMMRAAHECNLGAGSNWWGSGNAGSTASVVTLQQQITTYVRSLLGPVMSQKVLWVYNVNTGGNIAQLDPGPTFRDVVSIDIYQGTTQAQVISALNGQGMPALQALRDSNGNPVPILLSECGPSTFNNSAISLQTFDDSIFNGQLQASFPALVGGILWCQNWAPSVQNNWANTASHGILRPQVPAYT